MITKMSGKLSLEGEWLQDRDHIELELADGTTIPCQWHHDPVGRAAVSLQFKLTDGKLFKALMYIPEGTQARRIK